MKKLWKAKNDKEGVSPVIATILMVAITVVLAAILMVMVMGMTDGPAEDVSVVPEFVDKSTIRIAFATGVYEASKVEIKATIDGTETPVTGGSWSTGANVVVGSVYTNTDAFDGATKIVITYDGKDVGTWVPTP